MKNYIRKTEAKQMAEDIAGAVVCAFNVIKPRIYFPDYLSGLDWSARFSCDFVWTVAGHARISIDIDRRFAHMLFKFSNPSKAAESGLSTDRLNQFSGKWNRIASMENGTLQNFVRDCNADFHRVCVPNPPADEVNEWRAREALEAEKWARYRAEFAIDCAKKNAQSNLFA